MKKSKCAAILALTLVAGPLSPARAVETYSNPNETKEFVTDSEVTAAIKSKLAGDKERRFADIEVETDENGVVWMSGTADSQEAIENAVNIGQATPEVRAVQSGIHLRKGN